MGTRRGHVSFSSESEVKAPIGMSYPVWFPVRGADCQDYRTLMERRHEGLERGNKQTGWGRDGVFNVCRQTWEISDILMGYVSAGMTAQVCVSAWWVHFCHTGAKLHFVSGNNKCCHTSGTCSCHNKIIAKEGIKSIILDLWRKLSTALNQPQTFYCCNYCSRRWLVASISHHWCCFSKWRP